MESTATRNAYLWAQASGLATPTCPPNIKKLDYPPTKKPKRAPEFHIAVNLAPTPGGGPALQGTCIVSDSSLPQAGSASAPGPAVRLELTGLEGSASAPGPATRLELTGLEGSASAPGPATHLEELTGLEGTSSAPNAPPLGRRTYISKGCEALLELLTQRASTGRVPSAHDVLAWIEFDHGDVDGPYLDSYSEFEAFGIHDAFDIMETEVCYLATIGNLGRGGAIRLRQFTRDHILVPLGLWETRAESVGSLEELEDTGQIFQWRNGVEQDRVEDIEDTKEEVEQVDVVEEVEEVEDGESTGIEEIEGWSENSSDITLRNWNWGQWEEEV